VTAAADLPEFAAVVGLRLESFQRRIAQAACGPQRETVILIPRGNGKTTLLAAIALHHLLTVEDAAIYCAAASREQARILYEQAAQFALRLEDEHVVIRHLELRWCDDPEEPKRFTRHLRVLAADAPKLHGLTPSLAIIDELHAHRDDNVYLALRTATLKRPDSRLVVISTAGQGVDSALGRLRARALAQPKVKRRGAFTDAQGPSLRLLEWSLPHDADPNDAKAVKAVNPASWITEADLREQREAVPDLAFRRFHANQWVERAGHWLPPGAWQQITGQPAFASGEPVWIGVDVGGDRSTTAVAWVNENYQTGVWIGHGDQAVLEAGDVIRDLASTYSVREVMFDPWRAGQLAQELEQERLVVTAFPQSDSRMIPASARLHRAVVEKKLTVPDDDELRAQVANTIARHNRRGWRLDKPSLDAPNDAVVALCMAVEALENQPEPVQVVGWL
jgi:phage terminase large subunit-like protein